MIFQILIVISMLVGYVGFIFLLEYYYKRTKVNPEYTRKISHVVSSLSCAFFLLFIDSHWYILFVGLFFFVLLYFSMKKGLFKSINSVKRETAGSYLFPISIYIVFVFSDIFDEKLYFILPMLIMGISDSLAGTVGTVYKGRIKQIYVGNYSLEKTYFGSLAFLISSFLITLITLYYYGIPNPELLKWALIFGFSTTIIEALSSKGSDNITVPLITAYLIWLMI